MPLRPTIPDDAGIPVPIVRFRASWPIPIGPLPAKVQHAMYAETAKSVWGGRGTLEYLAVVASATSPAVLTALPLWISLTLKPPWLTYSRQMVAIFLMIPISWFIMWTLAPLSLSRLQRTAAARTAVNAGYCASCGYPLAGIAPDDRGLATCPECGACWNRCITAPSQPPFS